MYYANEESDDVIDRSTKTVQHSINISGSIEAVFLKLGIRNLRHKRNRSCHAVAVTIVMPLALF